MGTALPTFAPRRPRKDLLDIQKAQYTILTYLKENDVSLDFDSLLRAVNLQSTVLEDKQTLLEALRNNEKILIDVRTLSFLCITQ
jgi:hypothetical protein